MKQTPILMKSQMVRTTLNDRKTKTRRTNGLEKINQAPDRWHLWYPQIDAPGTATFTDHPQGEKGNVITVKCPYGQPGDQLWVRETWRCEELEDGTDGIRYFADAEFREIENTREAADAWDVANRKNENWRPSIFMPRWASRITLEITDIRVERVQDISRADCVKEGLYPTMRNDSEQDIRVRFRELWDSINQKRGYSWDANPWVWVVSFKRV